MATSKKISCRTSFVFCTILLRLWKVHSLLQNASDSFLVKGIRQMTFSAAAYCTEPQFHSNTIEKWNCKACKLIPNITANVFYSGSRDINGYVAYDKIKNEVIIAFSGTKATSRKNWVDDIDFPLIDYPYCNDCKVHSGFYKSFLSVAIKIRLIINNVMLNFSTAKISITGHSLGKNN